ncbi:hypothetical protein [Pseudoxanthomonas suwonensis]|jgi:hypothetical protein|uniref:hypothetical protein n=1 Tax=Pseudoxanthomonas suwonensis TaxID=314722 RepID=UPI00138F5FED|nr:hypothetical protein [Pseudoxanthomonas suwonensis]KAF1699319.1 hypothetical protein CSC68_14860 [Pseudoxanthomonas suwonensis]
MPHRKTLFLAVLSLGLAACASVQDDPLAPRAADCLVGGEKGAPVPGQPTSGRDRRCNPGDEAVIWSSERDSRIKLDVRGRGE